MLKKFKYEIFFKNKFHQGWHGIALFLSLAYSGRVYGQLVPPSLTDIYWFSSVPCPRTAGYIAGINTAMIDHIDSSNSHSDTNSLFVCAYYGNSGVAGGVVFTDLNWGYTVQLDYCLTGRIMAGSPDIVVGNDKTNPTTDYRVAAAYVNFFGVPQIDYYLVHYATPNASTFTVTPLGSTTFAGGYGPATCVHIDMIADFGNTSITRLPWCDTFVVTWNANIGSVGTPKLWTAMLSLSGSPGTFIPYGAPPAIPIGAGTMPDVAGIQRVVSSCATCGTSVDNIGLYTFTDGNWANLYYVEYDFTTSTLSSATALYFSAPYTLNFPRIDAPDDYNINSPSPLFSYYKVVVDNNGISMSFDNMNYSYGGANDAPYISGSGNLANSPTVAFGPNNNTQYAVAHYQNEGGFGTPDIFLEPIDWTMPFPWQIPALSPSFLPNWFQVNFNPITWVNGDYLEAISTPCNFPSDKTLVAWSEGAISDVHYKITSYGPPNGYAFRHEDPSGIPFLTKEGIQVYPNPASTFLNLNNSSESGSYKITDMPGRTLLSGALPNGLNEIDISSLASGNYIISAYRGNELTEHTTFVKE